MKKKPNTYSEIIEKNKSKLLAEGNSLDDIESFKKKQSSFWFRKSKRHR